MIDSRLDMFLVNGHHSDRDGVADQREEHDQVDADRRAQERRERTHTTSTTSGDRERVRGATRRRPAPTNSVNTMSVANIPRQRQLVVVQLLLDVDDPGDRVVETPGAASVRSPAG